MKFKINNKEINVVALFAIVFGVIAAILLLRVFASSQGIGVELESGTRMGNATKVADSSASGGYAIQFRAPSTAPTPTPTPTPIPTPAPVGVSSSKPCVASAAPAKWKHVVVLMFENHTHSQVIGDSNAPYITGLANKCGTSTSWHDGNYRVDGSKDGSYNSKPSYATITNGVPPSVHGLKDDNYSTRTGVDNIYHQLRLAGKSGKDYFSWSGTGCSARGSGDYHDAIRYYTNIDSAYCNSHDANLSTFMNDVNSGKLPDFSMILPTNCENMHSCSSISNVVKNGDDWAKNFLTPLLDSAQYKSGDTAIFFLWDEDTPIPNVLLAPSIKPGSKVPTPSGNPISHFSALRTWEEMLGLPKIGDSGKAPSLLSFYNGN